MPQKLIAETIQAELEELLEEYEDQGTNREAADWCGWLPAQKSDPDGEWWDLGSGPAGSGSRVSQPSTPSTAARDFSTDKRVDFLHTVKSE